MRMVKLTGIPVPDQNDGKSSPAYVDADRVVYIERSQVSVQKRGAREEYQQAVRCLYDEVTRTADVVKHTQIEIGKLDEMERQGALLMGPWAVISNVATDLKVAFGMVNSIQGPFEHPPVSCSTIGLAYGTASGDRIALFHVMESPEEVVKLLEPR